MDPLHQKNKKCRTFSSMPAVFINALMGIDGLEKPDSMPNKIRVSMVTFDKQEVEIPNSSLLSELKNNLIPHLQNRQA